ncbi:MAG: hypothetical protein JWM27_3461 [Gemmatimonadetes bacterium]|nr:hypothetical protein [Gemmatimonadota bacterium]
MKRSVHLRPRTSARRFGWLAALLVALLPATTRSVDSAPRSIPHVASVSAGTTLLRETAHPAAPVSLAPLSAQSTGHGRGSSPAAGLPRASVAIRAAPGMSVPAAPDATVDPVAPHCERLPYFCTAPPPRVRHAA